MQRPKALELSIKEKRPDLTAHIIVLSAAKVLQGGGPANGKNQAPKRRPTRK